MNRPSPYLSYLFKADIKKRSLFSTATTLEKFNYIRWMNGYFDGTGTFVEAEMIHLAKQDDFYASGDLFFIRE